MTTRSIPVLALALVAVSACDFADKSVGKEIVAGTSESGSGGPAEPATTEEEGDDDGGDVDDGAPAESSDDAAADDSPSDPGCVLDDYFDEVGIGNYLCGYSPWMFDDLQLTHDCLLEYMADTMWVLALWTSPEEPVMVALLGETGPNGYVVTWYEQRDGIVSSWTCAEVVDTPDCTVAPAEMCLTCVEPGAPTVLCPE